MSGKILSQISTILLALGMAFLVWIAAVSEEDPLQTKNIQPDIPLQVTPPAETLIIRDEEVVPDTIQVKIRAPQSVWQTLTVNKVKASIDLSPYSAGTHVVPIQVEISDPQAIVEESAPSAITVQFDALATKEMPVSVKILDEAPLGYFNRLPEAKPDSVMVKGSAVDVERVDQVVGKVRINNSKETVKQEVLLIPLDAEGEVVQNITLEPPNSVIAIPIEQRFGYKEVSVKAKLVGQPAPGYWISSISVNPSTVTLVGGPTILENVSGFIDTFEVDILGATEDVIKRVPLDLPPGSSVVADETGSEKTDRSVLVTVGISALAGGRTMQIGVTAQGVSQALKTEISPQVVEVILSGSLPTLNQLNKDDITVIVDLFGLPPGEHRLQLEVISPDEVEVASLIPDTVEVTLTPITGEKTPVPTLSPSPTVTATNTFTASTVITPNAALSETLLIPSTTLTSNAELTQTQKQD
ncbi:MAG TPA: hypothetical protein G4N96_14085 [Chloroflexi bacterium]|nr:MAG: hypothetical protein B6243_05930 [Anaerolineaceae bacterium 4572_5.2]HEY86230.1 hypothetical protein [Chloroflexota bacterium]